MNKETMSDTEPKKFPLREEVNKWRDETYETLSEYSMIYAMCYEAYRAGKESRTNANELIEKIKGQSYRLAGACHDVVSVKDVIEAIKELDI